jgi:hypothetical protein
MTTETKTVSKKAILEVIQEAYLKSLVHTGWHAVRVSPDGDIYATREASACYSEGEYFGRRPHNVTVWESSTGTGTMNDEDAENERENGDWELWFEVNVPTRELAEKLEGAGLELDDDC